VTWSTDSTFDGFYKVNSASVGMQHEQRNLDNLIFPFTVDLERPRGSSSVGFQYVNVTGGLRTNGRGVTTSDYQPYVSGGATSGAAASLVSTVSEFVTTRSGVANVRLADVTAALAVNGRFPAMIAVTPSTWYTYSPKLEIGTGAKRVVSGLDIDNLPANWQLSNGFVRVACNASQVLTVEAHNGTSWSTAKNYWFKATNATPGYVDIGAFTSIAVLQNTPARVSIRLNGAMQYTAGGTYVPTSITISLRRGSRMVEISGDYGYKFGSVYMQFYQSTSETGVGLTGGVQANANDGSGNRFVIASTGGTNVTTAGTAGIKDTNNWGVGLSIGGSGASAPERAQDLAYQYFAALGETITYGGPI